MTSSGSGSEPACEKNNGTLVATCKTIKIMYMTIIPVLLIASMIDIAEAAEMIEPSCIIPKANP